MPFSSWSFHYSFFCFSLSFHGSERTRSQNFVWLFFTWMCVIFNSVAIAMLYSRTYNLFVPVFFTNRLNLQPNELLQSDQRVPLHLNHYQLVLRFQLLVYCWYLCILCLFSRLLTLQIGAFWNTFLCSRFESTFWLISVIVTRNNFCTQGISTVVHTL